jgi:hypothetical protein
MAAHPSDPPPIVRSEPVVLGEVAAMTSHSVTVNTSKAETMTFEFDSRTLMPSELPSGTRVKVNFRTLDSGLHLAGRITTLEPGSYDWDRLERELAMNGMGETRIVADNEQVTTTTTTTETVVEPTSSADRTYTTQGGADSEGDASAQVDQEQPSGSSSSTTMEEELPRTASAQGWLLPVGVAAVVLAFALRAARRRRTV